MSVWSKFSQSAAASKNRSQVKGGSMTSSFPAFPLEVRAHQLGFIRAKLSTLYSADLHKQTYAARGPTPDWGRRWSETGHAGVLTCGLCHCHARENWWVEPLQVYERVREWESERGRGPVTEIGGIPQSWGGSREPGQILHSNPKPLQDSPLVCLSWQTLATRSGREEERNDHGRRTWIVSGKAIITICVNINNCWETYVPAQCTEHRG